MAPQATVRRDKLTRMLVLPRIPVSDMASIDLGDFNGISRSRSFVIIVGLWVRLAGQVEVALMTVQYSSTLSLI